MDQPARPRQSLLIGILSDTHICSPTQRLPPWVLAALQGMDLILHAGDIETPGLLTDLERLGPVYAVRGNCDQSLHHLPIVRSIQVPGGKVVLAHRLDHAWGAASADTLAIVSGHTHVPLIRKENGCWLVNPGSPRLPRGGNPPSIAVMTVQAGEVYAEFKYPTPDADD